MEPREVSRERGRYLVPGEGPVSSFLSAGCGRGKAAAAALGGTARAPRGRPVGLALRGVEPMSFSLHILPSRSLTVLRGVNTGG